MTIDDRIQVNDEAGVILPDELQKLTTLVNNSLETLAIGNPEIQTEALSTAKHIFELSVRSEEVSRPYVVDLISSLSSFHAPRTRSQTKAQAQAEIPLHEDATPDLFQPTPLNTLFTNGMHDEQVWAQLDLRTQTICRILDYVLEGETAPPDLLLHEDSAEDNNEEDERLQEALEALKRDEDIDMDDFLARYGLNESDLNDSEDDDLEEESSSENVGEEDMQEDISPLRDPSPSEGEASEFHSLTKASTRKRGKLSESDDNIVDLSDFNPDTDHAHSSPHGQLTGADSDEDDEEIDLFASVHSDVDFPSGEKTAQDIFYRDFFEPRSNIQKTFSKHSSNSQVRFHENVRVRKIKATGKNRSLRDDLTTDEDDFESESDSNDGRDNFDIQSESTDSGESREEGSNEGSVDESTEGTAIQRLKHDLFAEEAEEKNGDMTTHAKRMADIREQIARLESENVAPKEWMLMGEAGSRQRPQNSLLEEDLDFERVRKNAPVVTEEVVHNLEERIKARLLQGQFDDVVRIKPVEDSQFLPSKLIDLQDTKSKESLAQIYEAEYLGSQPGGQLPDDRDGRLRKEHDEITGLWDTICGKLDALCNSHFVPKQPKATITTVENTPSLMMESALPSSKSMTSMLAPEEIFSTSMSSLQASSELTPTEKRARRTKARKLRKRQRDILDKRVKKIPKAKGMAGVKKEKQAALNTLVKHGKGVTVVGKESVSQGKHKKK